MSASNVRFSKAVKDKLSEADRECLTDEFTEHFNRTGQRFIEMRFDCGDVLICNVTRKLFQIMFEDEW